MIFDTIDHLATYAHAVPHAADILQFLADHPAETLPNGNIDLTGRAYAACQPTAAIRSPESAQFEAHRRYIDLQLVLSGSEIIEYAPLADVTGALDYDAEKDLQFLTGQPDSAIPLRLTAGCFAVFYPQDAHKPLLPLHDAASCKIVFKIPV